MPVFADETGPRRGAAPRSYAPSPAPPVDLGPAMGGSTAALAPRLLAPPARWGWRPPEPYRPSTLATPLPDPPRWTAAAPVDTSALRRTRSRAVGSLVRRLLLLGVVLAVVALAREDLRTMAADLGEVALEVYEIVLPLLLVVLAVSVVAAIATLGRRTAAIAQFEKPYRAQMANDRKRHEEALAGWEAARRQHEEAAARLAEEQLAFERGPQWFPVHPQQDPVRVDVLGGDAACRGWASLLATVGTSVVAAGHSVTVLDLTGLDVAAELVGIVATSSRPASVVRLGSGEPVDVLSGVTRGSVATALADALVADGPERREEHAFVTEVLTGVVEALDEPVTLERMAAGIGLLRQSNPEARLAPAESRRLIESQLGSLGQGEWVQRRLRLLSSQLVTLAEAAPGGGAGRRPWTGHPVSVVTTPGGRGDRKTLVDRMLVRLAQEAVGAGTVGDFLVVVGGDHLGAEWLLTLAEHARRARVRLMLLIAHPPTELHRFVGDGGAVCFMKQYNHLDATLAAEFIGRGHRFVLAQRTVTTGRSFSDSGGDTYSAATTDGHSQGRRARDTSDSDSRSTTWGSNRGWSSNDSVGTSESANRVYEFIVEPTDLQQMPETAFILVDSTGSERRVVMADADPRIALLDHVATGA